MKFFKFTREEIIRSIVIILIVGGPYLYQTYKVYSYGKTFNNERMKLHLPQIGEDYKRSENWKYWSNPSNSYPQHSLKDIQMHTTVYDNYSIKTESDHFGYMQGDSLIELVAYYHFDENCCNYHYYGMGDHRKLSVQEFNQLLRENGFSFQYGQLNCK